MNELEEAQYKHSLLELLYWLGLPLVVSLFSGGVSITTSYGEISGYSTYFLFTLAFLSLANTGLRVIGNLLIFLVGSVMLILYGKE
jgi:hypothetical protein